MLVLYMPGIMVLLTWCLSLSQHLSALFRLKPILGVPLCFIFKLSVKSQCLITIIEENKQHQLLSKNNGHYIESCMCKFIILLRLLKTLHKIPLQQKKRQKELLPFGHQHIPVQQIFPTSQLCLNAHTKCMPHGDLQSSITTCLKAWEATFCTGAEMLIILSP